MLSKENRLFVEGFVTAVNYLKVAQAKFGTYDAEMALETIVRSMTNEYALVNLNSLVYDCDEDIQAKFNERTDVLPKVGTQYVQIKMIENASEYFDHDAGATALEILTNIDISVTNIDDNLEKGENMRRWLS